MITKFFKNRSEAGRFLAQKLAEYANNPNVIVLALPRGGVPVAYEVAQTLQVPLDIFVVRKLGVPGYDELAMGAIATGGIRILNPRVVDYLDISNDVIDLVAAREERELQRRERLYRGTRPALDARARTVIIVDDGMATGSTMRAAVRALRQQQPEKIIVAVPVGARETCESFGKEVDTMCVCAITPEPFDGVGLWYRDFEQTSDEEVQQLLERVTSSQSQRVA
ncbi:MAG TPA: phosphoribosyltransferase [Pyrinomonadaceae bacterium]|nr:phosphoribosyltransferase [Pyrinomonadaceae bacterium]